MGHSDYDNCNFCQASKLEEPRTFSTNYIQQINTDNILCKLLLLKVKLVHNGLAIQ